MPTSDVVEPDIIVSATRSYGMRNTIIITWFGTGLAISKDVIDEDGL